VRGTCAIALTLGALVACDEQPATPLPKDAGSSHTGMSQGHDAGGTGGAPEKDSGTPPTSMPQHDAGPPTLTSPDPVCSLAVGAECDGAEDCALGEVCCGTLEELVPTYQSISCQKHCDPPRSFEICHAGDKCRDGSECRRSSIIPHEFIGVCFDVPNRSDEPVGKAIKHEIACGPETCEFGTQKCCLNAKVTFGTPPAADPPYCAPLSANCLCDEKPPARSDAGGETDGG
jgi:hypothetical protein